VRRNRSRCLHVRTLRTMPALVGVLRCRRFARSRAARGRQAMRDALMEEGWLAQPPPAFHLAVERRISCWARYFARRAREIRSRHRYPARKPKGKPIKTAIAKSNILVPRTLLEFGRYSYSSLVCCGRMAAAPYCRASPRGTWDRSPSA
jgi:hypothetical protein